MAPERERIELASEVVVVRHLGNDDEAEACAQLMATSEPWVTLRRDYETSLEILRDPSREVYVAVRVDAADVVGFVIVNMRGAFVGYLQTVAVREDWRGRGLGTRLIAFAERRIFRDAPNVFMCVSSFNERARALYDRLGYEVIGEMRDYVVRGHSEWLLRKSIAPLTDWTTPRSPLAFEPRRAPAK
jgi:ribosomal protein S18 acetylase RimI-like enzyme